MLHETHGEDVYRLPSMLSFRVRSHEKKGQMNPGQFSHLHKEFVSIWFDHPTLQRRAVKTVRPQIKGYLTM